MLHFSHRTLIVMSGLLWFAVGLYLLPLGIQFLMGAQQGGSLPLMFFVTKFTSYENAIILLVALGLYIGYMKGKFVLSKAATKGADHVRSLPNPASITAVYTPKYLILLAVMMGIGMGMKFFNVPLDIRGVIDVAVGAALINGAMRYFRLAAA